MKHKTPKQPATMDTLRTLGHLPPTHRRNTRRQRITDEDRFTLLCMAIAAIGSVVVWIIEA